MGVRRFVGSRPPPLYGIPLVFSGGGAGARKGEEKQGKPKENRMKKTAPAYMTTRGAAGGRRKPRKTKGKLKENLRKTN